MGPPDSHRISRVPRYSGFCYASNGFVYRPITVCGGTFQNLPLTISRAMSQSYNPAHALRHQRFGLFPGRSPLLGESLLFSLPPGTKMFQFPGLAHAYACVWSSTIPVSRFRYLRITSCLQIPGAFRSLPRLSSPLEAKASSVRSSSLSRTYK